MVLFTKNYYSSSCSIKSQECIFGLSFSVILFNPSISPLAFIFKLHLKPVSISLSSLILPWSKHHHLSPDYNSQGDPLKNKSNYVTALLKNFQWLPTVTRIKYWFLMVAPQGCHPLVHLSCLGGPHSPPAVHAFFWSSNMPGSVVLGSSLPEKLCPQSCALLQVTAQISSLSNWGLFWASQLNQPSRWSNYWIPLFIVYCFVLSKSHVSSRWAEITGIWGADT